MIRIAEGIRNEVVAAYRCGEAMRKIAHDFQIGQASVWRILAEQGIPSRKRGRYLPSTIRVPSDPLALGYLAGLFDGEGNLYWRKRAKRAASIRFAIYSTTPAVMDWLQQTVGGYVRWDTKRVERRGWKAMGVWEISRASDVIPLLTALMPCLIVKRDLAQTALDDLIRTAEPPRQIYRP